jgi:hypothetical protein
MGTTGCKMAKIQPIEIEIDLFRSVQFYTEETSPSRSAAGGSTFSVPRMLVTRSVEVCV